MSSIQADNSALRSYISSATREATVAKKIQQVQTVNELSNLQLIQSTEVSSPANSSRLGTNLNVTA